MSVRYRLSTGPGSWPTPFTGVLDLGAPTTTNYGGGEVGFHYPVSGSFAVTGVTYTIAGTVLVHDQGAGLWDAGFWVPISASSGGSAHWESANGTFFTADGVPYPPGAGARHTSTACTRRRFTSRAADSPASQDWVPAR